MKESFMHSMVVSPEISKTYPNIVYGKGIYLFDEFGKKYIDACSGLVAVANIGHGIRELSDIIKDQAQKIATLPTHAFRTEIEKKYLEKLVQFAPNGFKHAQNVMTGNEAIENAVQTAIRYHQLLGNTKRNKIIAHKCSDYKTTTNLGSVLDFLYVQTTHTHKYTLSETAYCDHCVDEFQKIIEKNNPETIAAFIAAPIRSTELGLVTPPKKYYARIKKICEYHGILFIADEVMTGVGRLGTNFGMEQFQTIPDIIAVGNAISGGYFPLAAVILNDKIAAIFDEHQVGYTSRNTMASNPIGAAVGNYVLDYIEENNILENVQDRGFQLKKRLEELKVSPIVGEVQGEGLLLAVEFILDKKNKTPFPAAMHISEKIYQKALKKGIVIYSRKDSSNRIQGDHILVCPPLTITAQEVDFLADKIIETVAEIQHEVISKVEALKKINNTHSQLVAVADK